jgi:decaprenylphospho-beta-D-ribofuranose 2-oxidase
VKLSGWGRYPIIEAQMYAPRSENALRELVLSDRGVIARGNGRAYGDSAVNVLATIHMRHFNRLLSFDVKTGLLVAEAGVILGDIIAAFLPQGWFPAVTPGTKFVTLGGMIAADVHGKNHHRDGSFESCVDWVEVLGADGVIRHCSREQNADLLEWTLGGMGLTGIILRAAIRLRPVETGWIRQTTIPTANLEATMAAFESTQDAGYSVAWIDCLSAGPKLGRSLLMLGEHARKEHLSPDKARTPFDLGGKRRYSVPMDLPSMLLNRITVRTFNALYYWAGTRRTRERLVNWESYFYPLDAILGWNRIYGHKGFVQFQCVLPLDSSREGLTELLRFISKAGAGSFLAVLKRLGPQRSRFSFPMEGYTLALDFPVSQKILSLMNELDQITIAHGGRFYLAKDSRMTAETLRAADVRADSFSRMRDAGGLKNRFSSSQSQRLSL